MSYRNTGKKLFLPWFTKTTQVADITMASVLSHVPTADLGSDPEGFSYLSWDLYACNNGSTLHVKITG